MAGLRRNITRNLNSIVRKHKLKHKRIRGFAAAAPRQAIPAQVGIAEVGSAVEGA